MSSEDDDRPMSEEGQEDEGPMEDEGATLAIVLHSDASRLGEEFDKDEFPGAQEALTKYSILVKDLLIDLCGLDDFAHVEFLEVPSSYQAGGMDSPFCIVVGTPNKDADGELLGISGPALHTLDLMGALTAGKLLPDMFTNKLGLDDEGVLGFVDQEMADTAADLGERVGLEGRYLDGLGDDQDADLASALASLVPEGSDLSPVHPEDLLSVISVFLAQATKQAEAAPAASKKEKQRRGGAQGAGLITRIRGLVGAVRGAGASIMSQAGRRVRGLRGAVWRLEDLVTLAAKHGLRIAGHAVRPVLIGIVLHRALRTLESSRTLGNRMARMPPAKAVDYYFRTLLGDDYNKQIEADLAAAVAEVDAGLVTDDYVDEKRLLTAAMLRRLEVEDWDKERMKHFYYGSYGLGPWYFDMEERLHNPYFMGARAWNGPIEGWVNKNKVYNQDLPPLDFDAAALAAVQRAEGVALTPEQQQQILLREKVPPSAALAREGGILHGIKLGDS